jgi:hypothetical protein
MKSLYTDVATAAFVNEEHRKEIRLLLQTLSSTIDDESEDQLIDAVKNRSEHMVDGVFDALNNARHSMLYRFGQEGVSSLEHEAMHSAANQGKSSNNASPPPETTASKPKDQVVLPPSEQGSLPPVQSKSKSHKNVVSSNEKKVPSKKKQGKKKRDKQQKEWNEPYVAVDQDKLFQDANEQVVEIIKKKSEHPVVVGAIRLVEVILCQVEKAYDPQNPQLEEILPKLAHGLVVILQNLARYRKKLKCDINYDTSSTIGSLCCRLDEKNNGTRNEVSSSDGINISQLKAAIHRFKTDEDCPDLVVTDKDVTAMTLFVHVHRFIENLLHNLLHEVMMIRVESLITMEQLFAFQKTSRKDYSALGDAMLETASDLWDSMYPGQTFDKTMSMLRYRQEVLLPGLATSSQECQSVAIGVAQDMAEQLTDFRKGGRKEILQPAFIESQSYTVDGNEAVQSEDDYCGSSGNNQGVRRGRMTCLRFNLSAKDNIQQQLPSDLFPRGFVPTLLTNAPTSIKLGCNFAYKKSELFDKIHDNDSPIVKGINNQLKDFDLGEQNIIIDDEVQIESLKQLLER